MGRSLPAEIVNKPMVLPGNTLYLQAYYDLDGERQLGMSVGRIPWSAINHYAAVYEFTAVQQSALFYLIGRMDAANLQHISAAIQNKARRNVTSKHG